MRNASDIPAALLNIRLNVAESYGANRAKILQEAQLDPERLSNPTNRITVTETMRIWEAMVRQLGREDMGLRTGAAFRLQHLGLLGYVMMNSQTLEKALKKLSTYQRLVMAIARQSLHYYQDRCRTELEMQEEWQETFRYTIDFMLAATCAYVQNSTGVPLFPLKVGFNYPQFCENTVYQEVFGPAEIIFDCEKPYIEYKIKDLQQPIIGSDHQLFDHFEKLLQQEIEAHDQVNQYSRKVKSLIQQGLQAEIPGIEQVAREMAMSVRSLQLALKKEQTTYQALLREVRKEFSIHHLKNRNFNVSDVAFLAGFSDLTVFSRNFKKWTGMTPSQFQRQLA